MALQRQVLVRGWQFEDLGQLDQLTVPVTASLLVALTAQPKERADRTRSQALAEDLVNDAKGKLEEVKRAASAAAAADGLTAPSVEVLLVDYSHIEVENLRRRLGALLVAAQRQQDKEANLQRIVKRCRTVIVVVGFITTAALQIPEVQQEAVRVGSDLLQVIEQVTEAVRAQVGTLGVIAAARFAAGPSDGFSPVDSPPGPDSPQPGGPEGIVAEFMTMGGLEEQETPSMLDVRDPPDGLVPQPDDIDGPGSRLEQLAEQAAEAEPRDLAGLVPQPDDIDVDRELEELANRLEQRQQQQPTQPPQAAPPPPPGPLGPGM
jgi:hypothetical protein